MGVTGPGGPPGGSGYSDSNKEPCVGCYEKQYIYDENGRKVGYTYRRRNSFDCFVATASMRAKGLPLDSPELNILRAFRNEYIRRLPFGQFLISIYYWIGPRIVVGIDKREDSTRIYSSIYNQLVVKTIYLINKGKRKEALWNGARMIIQSLRYLSWRK